VNIHIQNQEHQILIKNYQLFQNNPVPFESGAEEHISFRLLDHIKQHVDD